MQTQHQTDRARKAVLGNNTLKVFLLLQEAERNIAAAERLSEDSKFSEVVLHLCRRAIICCKRAYFLYTGKALSVNKVFSRKDALAALLYACQIFADVFAVVKDDEIG